MENRFRKHLQERRVSTEDIEFSVNAVREFEEYVESKDTMLESAGLKALKDYVSLLIDEDRNSWERLVRLLTTAN